MKRGTIVTSQKVRIFQNLSEKWSELKKQRRNSGEFIDSPATHLLAENIDEVNFVYHVTLEMFL